MTTNDRDDELHLDEDDEFELPADIAALLGDEAIWADVGPAADESIVAAIMTEVAASPTPVAEPEPQAQPEPETEPQANPDGGLAPVVQLAPTRWRSMALGAAAALLVVAGIFGITQLATSDPPDFEVAMAGTDLAPDASAQVELTDTPQGTRIVIDVEDLPPAPPGMYYEAWLRQNAEIGVSAGTFHLRSGDDEIELWAGVWVEDYPLITVTLQEEAQTESSGQVVLRVLIGE